MLRRNALLGFAALALLAMTPKVEAGFSTVTFLDLGNPVVNGTTIANSTVFTIGDLQSKSPTGTGNLFDGTPVANFGQLSFNLTNPNTFTFGTGTFGFFTASTITAFNYSNDGNIESEFFYFSGSFTPGTSNNNPVTGLGPMSLAASFVAEFSISGGSVNDGSFSLSIPPAPLSVPEPASIAMLGLGLSGLAGVALCRRSAK